MPGDLLSKGGRDGVHFLRIDTPADIGGKPPTLFRRIDFVGMNDSSGWRATSQFVYFVDTARAIRAGIVFRQSPAGAVLSTQAIPSDCLVFARACSGALKSFGPAILDMKGE